MPLLYGPGPMLVYIVIGFWVVLGVSVFLVAMRGGPRGAREALHTESKASRRSVALVVVVLFAFGLAVPGLVIASNSANKASVAVGGVHLNRGQQKGRELFARSCGVCHTLAATNSVGHIGPNLDIRLGSEIATEAGRKALVMSAISEGRARGLGQMPALLYQGKEAEDIAAFLAAVAGH